jgi:hypothetical protein
MRNHSSVCITSFLYKHQTTAKFDFNMLNLKYSAAKLSGQENLNWGFSAPVTGRRYLSNSNMFPLFLTVAK